MSNMSSRVLRDAAEYRAIAADECATGDSDQGPDWPRAAHLLAVAQLYATLLVADRLQDLVAKLPER